MPERYIIAMIGFMTRLDDGGEHPADGGRKKCK
jgi:hypothetical protein